MKSSDIAKARKLISEEENCRQMEGDAVGFPGFDGRLEINGRSFLLPRATVERLLTEEMTRISDAAAAIGLEFDQ